MSSREEMVKTLAEHLATRLGEELRENMTTCLNCVHFAEKNGELCGLAGKRPPARIIALGCERYLEGPPF